MELSYFRSCSDFCRSRGIGASAVSNTLLFGTRQSPALCPCVSDVDFLGDLDGVIDLDAKVADGALDLRVPK